MLCNILSSNSKCKFLKFYYLTFVNSMNLSTQSTGQTQEFLPRLNLFHNEDNFILFSKRQPTQFSIIAP